MGKGKGGDLPSFLNSRNDIETLIRMQEQANQRAADMAARYNFFDIVTPFGSRTFEGTPGQEGFRQIESLPEAEQEFLNRQRELRLGMQGLSEQHLGQLADIYGTPIAGGQEAAAELERATYQRGQNLMQPGFDEQRARLENSLIQRGIPRGSEAYNQEMDRLGREQGTALENLALSSVQAGRQEQSRQLQSDLARRSGMINEFAAMSGGGPAAPSFQATPSIGIGAADVMGPTSAVGQNIANQQAAQQAAKAAGKGGASQLGSAALMAYGGGGGFGGGKGGKGGANPQVGSQFSPWGFGYG